MGRVMTKERNITSKTILETTLNEIAPLPSQREYAKNLATIFSMHLHKNQLIDQGYSADELPAPSAIVVASTGQGKTFLLRKMAECLDVNLITIDCSTLSAEGWRGTSLSQRLAAAMGKAKNQKAFTQSILFFDEIDKLRYWGTQNDQGNAMSNILQLFNGGTMSIEVDKRVQNLDVRRFTILFGGAFVGIKNIIRERICPKTRVGFCNQPDEAPKTKESLLQLVTMEDLVKFGLMPELLGRIGTILTIPPLTQADYCQLLNAKAGSLQTKYNNYLSLYGTPFKITEAGINIIAEKCMTLGIGARAVNSLVDDLMRHAIVNVENDETINKVILDADGNECCIRYEHGSRDIKTMRTQHEKSQELPLHTVKAKNTPALVRKLCRYYRNTAGDLEVLGQLEPFLNCSITYLQAGIKKEEFNFDSLEKLACITRRENDQSAFERLICESHDVPLLFCEAFRKAYSPWLPQNVTAALETIKVYIWNNHGMCQVQFAVPDGK